MRRRTSLCRIFSLAALILPMKAMPLQQDLPDADRGMRPPPASDPERPSPEVDRDPPGDAPGNARAQGREDADPPSRAGAGSMEPNPEAAKGDRTREDAAEVQHREWLQSIWNSP